MIWIVPVAILALLILVFIPLLSGPEKISTPTYWPTDCWRSSTPEEHGFNSAKLAEALLTIREQNINIHSLLIIRNGEVVVDAYFSPYDGTTVHDQASVTKSVMTTLIDIDDEQGKLQLDDPVVSYFPERTIPNLDDRKESINLRLLASMSSGLDCTSERDEATLNEMMESPDWVENSVKVQMDTGDDDDYGYVWWLSTDEPVSYSTIGRGGQRILVVPAWNLIVVTTGGGFDFDEIEPLLVETIVDLDKTLPANPAGMVRLEEALNAIVQPPEPKTIAPLPDMARNISGKTFAFEPNTVNIRFDFNDSDEAIYG